jgi:membrane-associated phospholipid phosphatase
MVRPAGGVASVLVGQHGPMTEQRRATQMPTVERWVRRTPALLILAAGLVALSLLGWLFGETAEAVLEQDGVAAIDDPVTRWLVQQRQPRLTAAMRAVTTLGDAWFVVALVVAVTLVLWLRGRRWSETVVLPIASGGAALIVTLIKVAMERPRPMIGEIVATASGFSFPSGHSAQAVACYGALAWLVAHLTATRRATLLAWSIASVVAFLIGASRLYLGVHWLSDVIGGWALGAAWLTVTLSAVVARQRWTAARP